MLTLLLAQVLTGEAYRERLLADLAEARESVVASMYVVRVPDGEGRASPVTEVLDALVAAARRGVQVRLLLHDPQAATVSEQEPNNGPAVMVLRAAMDRPAECRGHRECRVRDHFEVFTTPPAGRRTLHAKFVAIDDRVSFVGSHNWTSSALGGRNFEVTLRSEEPGVARDLVSAWEHVAHQRLLPP